MSQLPAATSQLIRWRKDPVAFVRENFKVEPDPWQYDVLKAFPHNQRQAMKACKGPGKTCLLAWLNWNFLSTRVNPKMAATSISKENLSDGLWAEMALWQSKSKWLSKEFQWNKTRIHYKKRPETWFLAARAWSKQADQQKQADTLAGFHADNLMYTLDEAGGIPDAVMVAAKAGLSTVGGEKHILMAGNPTHLEGPLYRASTIERDKWHLTEITGDPKDPKRAPRIDLKWAQDQIDEYGADNPWVLVNVFGKFPPASLNSMIGPEEVEEAMRRHLRLDQYDFAQKRIGCDVARFGDDSTIMFPRQGLAAFMFREMRNARSTAIADQMIFSKLKWGSEMEFVDGTGGYGAGVIDSMIEKGYSPYDVQFAGKPIDGRFVNKRAEIWFNMVNWIKRGGALPYIPGLVKELTAPTYMFHKGKYQLEEKDQIKARLGFSPDKADALACTFALPEAPKSATFPGMPGHGAGGMLADGDPFK